MTNDDKQPLVPEPDDAALAVQVEAVRIAKAAILYNHNRTSDGGCHCFDYMAALDTLLASAQRQPGLTEREQRVYRRADQLLVQMPSEPSSYVVTIAMLLSTIDRLTGRTP